MASPTPPDISTINGKKYRQVREGLASVLARYSAETPAPGKHIKNNDEGSQAVFYNPIQQFNRDLSVLAIIVYGEGALLEKESKFNQKTQHAKNKKNMKKPPNPVAATQAEGRSGNLTEHSNTRKRKADELEDHIDVTAAEPAKKAKAHNEFDVEDDDELLVAELIAHAEEGQNKQEALPSHRERPWIAPQEASDATAKKRQTPFTILDALSATGLRALRYAKEIPFATKHCRK